MIFWLYIARLRDRQKEIDRIAGDNREYRDRFLAILDDKLGLRKGNKLPQKVEAKGETK
jgi:hypothetical protein